MQTYMDRLVTVLAVRGRGDVGADRGEIEAGRDPEFLVRAKYLLRSAPGLSLPVATNLPKSVTSTPWPVQELKHGSTS